MDEIEYKHEQQYQDRLINYFVYWWAYNAVQPNLITKIAMYVFSRLLKRHLEKYGKIWDVDYTYWKGHLKDDDKVI